MRTIAMEHRNSALRSAPRDARSIVSDLLAMADIRIDGARPWDIRVHRPEFFQRLLGHGSLGLGESYMDGDWDVDQLDEFFHRVLRARLDRHVKSPRLLLPWLMARLSNRQNRRRAWRVGEVHYDLGNDFHRMWRYYLLSCAGAFRARELQVWQWTLTKHGMPGGCGRVA